MKNRLIEALMRRMGFATAETRNWDKHDFREVAVWSAKEALEAAYEAGRKSMVDTIRKPYEVVVPVIDYGERTSDLEFQNDHKIADDF